MAAFLDQKSIRTLLVTAVVVAVLLCVPMAGRAWLEEEHGLLELPTAIVLLLGAVLCLRGYVQSRPRRAGWLSGWLSASIIMLVLAMRELDFQKRFTPMTIETTRFYISPSIPWTMKLVVILLLWPVAAAHVHLGWLLWQRLRIERTVRQPWVGHLALAGVMLLVSRIVEKIHIKSLYVVEETLELSFAFFLIWLIQDFTSKDAP